MNPIQQDNTPTETPAPQTPLYSPSTPMNPTPTEVTEPTMISTAKKKSFKLPLIALLIALLVAGGAAAWFLLKKDTKSTKSTAASTVIKKEIPLMRVMSGESNDAANFYPPAYASGTNLSTIRKQIFETLVTFSDGKNIVPLLATSWTNPDTSTWIFKLNPNIKFHNGNPVTSKQVKASIEAAAAIADYEAFTSTIKTIEATDANTVKIVTKTPDVVLLNKLAFISIYDSTAKTIDDQTGTGPYVVKKGTALTDALVSLSAVDSYHGGTVYTKAVDYILETDPAKLTASFIAGKADIALSISNDQITEAKKAVAGSVVFSQEATGTYSLYLNTVKAGPLQKLAVRQAIYNGVDAKKVLEAGGAPGNVATQIVSSLVPGYNPSITSPKQDIVAAKKLLVDAGYPNGVTINVTSTKQSLSIASELKTQLAAIGITLNILEPNLNTFFADAQSGKFEAWLASYSTDINDASDVITAEFQNTVYTGFYKNPKVDEIMVKANSTFNISQRLTYLQQANKAIMEDLPIVPIRNRTYQYISNKPYVIPVDYASGSVLGANFWKVYQK
jgi:peptide/nickel transport system substrate-binding protein